jgi:hypothetical protein
MRQTRLPEPDEYQARREELRRTSHPRLAGDTGERGVDLLSPVWHLPDLTPAGRGDWYASLDYSAQLH